VIEQEAQDKSAAADTAKVKIQNCSKEDLRGSQEIAASQSAAQEPGSWPRSPQSKLPFGSDEPSPSDPPTLPPLKIHQMGRLNHGQVPYEFERGERKREMTLRTAIGRQSRQKDYLIDSNLIADCPTGDRKP
jgi:hypothetical protein